MSIIILRKIRDRLNALQKAFLERVINDEGTVESIQCVKDSNASLQMTPSGYKPTKLYSVLPTDGDGDFTVDRDCEKTRVNADGLIETIGNNVPSIDYSDGGCPVLLTEPQSTNLYLNSEVLSTQNVNTNASTYTVSFYGTGTINLSGSYTGVLVGTGANDLVQLTFTASAGTLTSTVSGLVNEGQCENLSYATSRIRTLGSTVIRLQDVVTDAGDVTTFNSEEGVLYCEIAALSDDGTFRQLSISDGTQDNMCAILFTNTSNQVRFDFKVSGGFQVLKTYTLPDATLFNNIAVKWKLNDFALYVNGVEVEVDSSGLVPTQNTFNTLSLEVGLDFFGKTKAIKVYKSIADAQIDLPYIPN